MTWKTFFAAENDFVALLEGMLEISDSRLFEVYSPINIDSREFTTALDACQVLQLGHDVAGTGHSTQVALWVPSVMPRPSQRRFAMTTGNWRATVEGCGLFWLQAGGRHASTITESCLGWFTEGAARQRCAVEPGPEEVDWARHGEITKHLTKLLARVAVAHADRFPVLDQAAKLHVEGYRLLYGVGIKRDVAIDAA